VLRIDVITIFPGLFAAFREVGVLGGAIGRGEVALEAHDLRGWTHDKHRKVDDAPYGGGPGMVMRPEPLVEGIEALAGPKGEGRKAVVVLLTPQGESLSQNEAEELAQAEHLVLVCGRYEGIDQRVIDLAVDREISIGDYVVSGGEAPAMVVIEALTRFVPGVLGNPDSTTTESFQEGRLEGPQYTRPVTYRGKEVPQVLRSGDHAKIRRWRKGMALERTQRRRPDLSGAQGDDG
jgi:tRNA (guanine37-N1)-methyltransferase